MVHTRISPSVANVKVRSTVVNTRVTSGQGVRTPQVFTTIAGGTPLGLLLSLTYSKNTTFESTPMVFYGDLRPTVRINTI